ncbi:folylpolyglutamate synthase/dihydrofolate synthase family protein [Ponticaulis sp.]|uniref:bifunctional folylpolyglutamate synthase/dihydrofolate synthase n=1 Tax=Ponticaulis sp. TaxID=2020902 RepID=UPI000B6A2997|nr:folylpolyglutamate synthase/dihydrofolate synthase family protein [Ponticaulis sp.]MAI91643.1 bifunctional folylpolyglutamate synthase/dihydrofolate synthase [Ponticaulis sp.]OUX97209.1 MAG: hypothetical protein CBB65_14475 [Hyphomonadaceae bacterium TMED5]
MLTDLLSAFDALPKPASFKLSTAPVRRVLEALGRPQDKMPPVIHVAGTNGKGSTTAFMRAIAEAHGLKVHVDTSPHLISVNERIRIAGKLISDEALRSYAERVLEANGGEPISFFEGITCCAYLAFSETPADLTLIEVGLGGRFDSTNVFDHPAVSVITPIDYDHKEFLGRHICQIAWEKGGIIKSGSPVVSAPQHSEVARTLKAEARVRKSDISFLNPSDISFGEAGTLSAKLGDVSIEDMPLGLEGPHQAGNASLAIMALQASGVFELKDEALRAGLAKVSWPARLQPLGEGDVTRALPGKTVLVDGGHNPHAARAISKALAPHAPVPAIIAMLSVKDAKSYLSEMASSLGHVAIIPMPGDRKGHDPEALAEVAREIGLSASAYQSFDDALARIAQEKSDHALICGSLYLAGDVLARNGEVIS